MKYHITLARNDVIGKLGGSRFPYSLDDFNEPCTAVIMKKKLARQVFVRCSSRCSYFSQIIQHFFKFIFVRVFKKKDFGDF